MTYDSRNIHIQLYTLNWVVGQQSICLLTGLLKKKNQTAINLEGKKGKALKGHFTHQTYGLIR